MDQYFSSVRPLTELGSDIPNLFILPGSRPVTDVMYHSKFLFLILQYAATWEE